MKKIIIIGSISLLIIIFIAMVFSGNSNESQSDIKLEKVKIDNVIAFKVRKGYWDENKEYRERNREYKVVWPDENLENKKYPHRFLFYKQPILSFNDVQFNRIAKHTINSLRKIMIASPNEISYPHFVEIISNFTFS